MQPNDLMITGCGMATSIGCSTSELMKNLDEGTSYFQHHRQIEPLTHPKSSVAYVNDENLKQNISSRVLRKLDRFTLLSMQAFQQVQASSKLNTDEINPFGILLGNCTGGWSFVEPQMDEIHKGNYDVLSPYVATTWFPTAPQGEISIQNKITGYSKTFAADALSAAYALEHASYLIHTGYLPGAFVGGVEAPLSPLVYNACIREEPISPTGTYLPFHNHSDGYLLGEGAGFLSIESYEHVCLRKGTSLARITGLGIGNSLQDAIKACLDQAKISPQSVECIFLDAKGTTAYDEQEYESLSKCFHPSINSYLTTTKTLHGSLLAADFAVQLSIAVLTLIHEKIPRGLWSKNNHKHPSFGQLVLDQPIDKSIKNVLLYARNLDGSSISVLIEK